MAENEAEQKAGGGLVKKLLIFGGGGLGMIAVGLGAGWLIFGSAQPDPSEEIEEIIERLDQYQQIKDSRLRIEATDLANLPPRSSDLNVRNLPFNESDLDTAEVGSGVLTPEARQTAYEETGYLVRVRSTRNDAPQYAIVDEQGAVQVFVTPQPGLNLSTYIRRHVGVFGRRGYLYRLKTQHVTVTKIVDLDRHKK